MLTIGSDIVNISIPTYNLGRHLEDLKTSNQLLNYNLEGNSLSNIITGNKNNKIIDEKGGKRYLKRYERKQYLYL